MSENQVKRRLAALQAQIENIAERMEALSKGLTVTTKKASPKKTTKKTSSSKGKKKATKKTKKASTSRRTNGEKAIGKTVPYRDGKVKIVRRESGRYIAKVTKIVHHAGKTMKKGKEFPVATRWIFNYVVGRKAA